MSTPSSGGFSSKKDSVEGVTVVTTSFLQALRKKNTSALITKFTFFIEMELLLNIILIFNEIFN
jgi:hypothetical protein